MEIRLQKRVKPIKSRRTQWRKNSYTKLQIWIYVLIIFIKKNTFLLQLTLDQIGFSDSERLYLKGSFYAKYLDIFLISPMFLESSISTSNLPKSFQTSSAISNFSLTLYLSPLFLHCWKNLCTFIYFFYMYRQFTVQKRDFSFQSSITLILKKKYVRIYKKNSFSIRWLNF